MRASGGVGGSLGGASEKASEPSGRERQSLGTELTDFLSEQQHPQGSRGGCGLDLDLRRASGPWADCLDLC